MRWEGLPRHFFGIVATWFIYLTVMVFCAEAAEPDDTAFFQERIEPVLKERCYGCHSGQDDKIKGGLRLDSRAAVLRGGESGPAVIPGKSSASLLIQAIRHEGGVAMPPGQAKLADKTIADFVKWVDTGIPRDGVSLPDDTMAGLIDARKHWAFQPVKEVTPPQVNDGAWTQSPLDAFVLAKLEERLRGN